MSALPTLVGESPSRTGDRYHRFPLSGAPARTLCQCAGWPPDGPGTHLRDWTWALYARFTTVNVFPRYADATPWSAPAARERAAAIVYRAMQEEDQLTFVLLGRRVAAAFDMGDVEPYEIVERRSLAYVARLVAIPHPSGRNLLLNSSDERERIGATLRLIAGD